MPPAPLSLPCLGQAVVTNRGAWWPVPLHFSFPMMTVGLPPKRNLLSCVLFGVETPCGLEMWAASKWSMQGLAHDVWSLLANHQGLAPLWHLILWWQTNPLFFFPLRGHLLLVGGLIWILHCEIAIWLPKIRSSIQTVQTCVMPTSQSIVKSRMKSGNWTESHDPGMVGGSATVISNFQTHWPERGQAASKLLWEIHRSKSNQSSITWVYSKIQALIMAVVQSALL